MNPSVILLPDKAASKHPAKVLVKRAKEICLVQNGRLLNQATRLNRFFLPPFPPRLPPGCSVGFPSVPLERRRQRAAYKRQGCGETRCVISAPCSPRLSHRLQHGLPVSVPVAVSFSI